MFHNLSYLLPIQSFPDIFDCFRCFCRLIWFFAIDIPASSDNTIRLRGFLILVFIHLHRTFALFDICTIHFFIPIYFIGFYAVFFVVARWFLSVAMEIDVDLIADTWLDVAVLFVGWAVFTPTVLSSFTDNLAELNPTLTWPRALQEQQQSQGETIISTLIIIAPTILIMIVIKIMIIMILILIIIMINNKWIIMMIIKVITTLIMIIIWEKTLTYQHKFCLGQCKNKFR